MCEDFLAFHPFSDAELIATLQNSGHTWKDLHIQFNAAFYQRIMRTKRRRSAAGSKGRKKTSDTSHRLFTCTMYMCKEKINTEEKGINNFAKHIFPKWPAS